MDKDIATTVKRHCLNFSDCRHSILGDIYYETGVTISSTRSSQEICYLNTCYCTFRVCSVTACILLAVWSTLHDRVFPIGPFKTASPNCTSLVRWGAMSDRWLAHFLLSRQPLARRFPYYRSHICEPWDSAVAADGPVCPRRRKCSGAAAASRLSVGSRRHTGGNAAAAASWLCRPFKRTCGRLSHGTCPLRGGLYSLSLRQSASTGKRVTSEAPGTFGS